MYFNNNFKSFENKTKLLEDTVAQPTPNNNYGTLKAATFAVPLKYLSNLWRSLEMPLINCKVKLKLKWTEYCVLAAAGTDNTNVNYNNIIFTIKEAKLYVPVVTLSDNQKLSKFLSNGTISVLEWI